MRLRELTKLSEYLERTGKGKSAVVGWGRGMGHKGHMFLASSVITQATENDADPYFVVSRTVGKDDPITPEEKLAIYKKVFPKHGNIFQTATEEMPDLTRVLTKLDHLGYTDVTVVVGADQVKALSYVKNYNGQPNKAGDIPFKFNSLNVISRQETNDPSREQEGPRATPMRAALMDPAKSDEEKFAVWRDAMSPELSDEEVRDLMNKAQQRMASFEKPKAAKKTKEKAVAKADQELGESTSLPTTLKAIINDIGEPVGMVYDTMKFMAKKYYENHGEINRGFNMVAAGVGGRWVQKFYVGKLHNELYDLCKYNTRRTVELQQFLRGREEGDKIELTRSFKNISQELPPILVKIGQYLDAPQLVKNAQRWMQRSAEYEQYVDSLDDDYEEPVVKHKAPKDPTVGQQHSQVDQIVNQVLGKVPSKVAGEIRNAIARNPNKLQALQSELQKRNINVSMLENK